MISRGWAGVLVASLALNLFGGGFLASNAIFHVGSGKPTPPVAANATPAAARAAQVTPAVVRSIVDNHSPAINQRVKQLRQATTAVTAALNADPFDPMRLQRALAQLR